MREIKCVIRSGTGLPTLSHGTQNLTGPDKVPLGMRRACSRWSDEGSENLVGISASISEVGHNVKKIAAFCLLREVADVVVLDIDAFSTLKWSCRW